jgi:hypothetical protein
MQLTNEEQTPEQTIEPCKTIEEALATWYATERKDPDPVLNAILAAMLADAAVIVPVVFPENFVNSLDPETGRPRTPKEAEEKIRVQFQRLDAGEDRFWFAAFTGREEVLKGAETSTLTQPLRAMAEAACAAETCVGLVLNPWGQSIALPNAILQTMLERSRPLTEDELNLQKGAEAYQRGDFAEAVRFYQLAADAGNVTALSNLGFCHYYGRSVPVDKAAAQRCWEQASAQGDVCATYKLGDLYRNGDLPVDEARSNELYQKAFGLAVQEKDLFSYPEACLRMLKFCKEVCSAEAYAAIARDAAAGFQARVEAGDPYSQPLYQEANAILESLQQA